MASSVLVLVDEGNGPESGLLTDAVRIAYTVRDERMDFVWSRSIGSKRYAPDDLVEYEVVRGRLCRDMPFGCQEKCKLSDIEQGYMVSYAIEAWWPSGRAISLPLPMVTRQISNGNPV